MRHMAASLAFHPTPYRQAGPSGTFLPFPYRARIPATEGLSLRDAFSLPLKPSDGRCRVTTFLVIPTPPLSSSSFSFTTASFLPVSLVTPRSHFQFPLLSVAHPLIATPALLHARPSYYVIEVGGCGRFFSVFFFFRSATLVEDPLPLDRPQNSRSILWSVAPLIPFFQSPAPGSLFRYPR